MQSVKTMPEAQRRAQQEAAGLQVIKRKPAIERTERNMNNQDGPQTQQNEHRDRGRHRGQGGVSQAALTLQEMAAPPTYKQLALTELKRATVWVPMLVTTGFGLLWVNKRFFLPKVG